MEFSVVQLIPSPPALPEWVESSTSALSSPFVSTTVTVLLSFLLCIPVAVHLCKDTHIKEAAKQWHRVVRIYKVLHPFFIPPDRAAARTLFVNLLCVGICILVGRVVHLVSPLLLRNIVDNLARGQQQRRELNAATTTITTTTTTAAAAAAAAQTQGGAASTNMAAAAAAAAPMLTFPWPQIVAYIIIRHIVPRIVSHHEYRCGKVVCREVSNRISIAAYRQFLSFGADYHETELRANKKKKAEDKKNGNDSDSPALDPPYYVVLYLSPWGARWVSSWVFSSAPSVVDLFVGLGAFWSVGGGVMAATMAALLVLFIATSVAQILGRDDSRKKDLRDAQSARFGRVVDRLTNWQTVELFGTRDHETEGLRDLGEVEQRLEDEEMGFDGRWGFGRGEAPPFFVEMAGLLLLSLMSGWQIDRGERSIGDFVMLTHYYRELISPVNQILWSFRSAGREIDRLMQVVNVLERQPAVRDGPDAPEFEFKSGRIEFRDVVFSYPDAKRPALDGVSFSVEGGQTVAIVGETGGGKSTLLKLLCRTHDTTSGSVLIDGQDVRAVRRATLLDRIAVVPQLAGVLSASVLDNVRYGRPSASEEKVEEACRAAHLHQKITTAFSDGYGEQVGSRGSTQLSGGEAQRLAIARALVRDARIVIFDEAMSSLDSETEWKIQTHLREWCRDRTVVIVAHRLATVAQADLILAIKDGKVVERGTQAELLAKEGYYHNLWTKQKLVA
ncbi:hypothetical protein PpBr36_07576 [Pyricularia pennisetigena]|uniref:hypothetical protein n=1 Tax=Pyricularia pennisetigena TaxID=1578925 RepID=UPI00115157E9|nr:hypothetical protein PpBr36_07576 [Pyricularia pennisetigena]TLS25347.1 hypothetical protein PpBr36_07576 [Pyricularia pennisetigena]